MTSRRRWLRPGPPADVGSFRRQLVLATAILGAAVAVVLIVVVQVALTHASGNAVSSVMDDRADAVISSVDAATTGPTLAVPDARLDAGVAVYDEDGRLVGGSVPPSQADEFEDLSTVTAKSTVKLGDAYQILGQPFTTSSGAHGVVVIAERLDPYQDTIHYALAISVAAGGLIVLLATVLAAWASRRALEPVAQMARTAEEWSEHDLDRRFDLGPPTNEIRALGRTLDGLLERVRRVILDEQRLTSELAHELRTPLAAALATAEVLQMRDDLDDELREDLDAIAESCRAMAVTVTGLLDLARSMSSAATRESAPLGLVMAQALRDLGGADRVRTEFAPDLVVATSVQLAVRAIGPVLDNATRMAEHVMVTASTRDRWVEVRVEDDGPGVAADEAAAIFEPGHTGGGGSGLGLALARRVARSVGGEVSLEQRPGGGDGAVFVVRLPTAPETSMRNVTVG